MSHAHLIDSRTIKSQPYPEFTAIRRHGGGFIYRDGTVVKTKLRATNPLGFKHEVAKHVVFCNKR